MPGRCNPHGMQTWRCSACKGPCGQGGALTRRSIYRQGQLNDARDTRGAVLIPVCRQDVA